MTRSPAGRGFARQRPAGAAAWLLRLPVLLYDLELGWLLGHRFAEITHRGRRSGLVHRTVVEVTRFTSVDGEVIVVSAWAGRTDWYRNLQAEPALQVRIGRARFVPKQRFLSADETLQELRAYVRRHPIAARLMPWLFGIDPRTPAAGSSAGAWEFFRGVAFRPGQR